MSRIPSPQSGRRGCLCKDNTYSIECCDGSFQAQGVGNVTATIQTPSAGEYGYRVQKCGHSQKKHFYGSTQLVVGNVYYINADHDNHDGCYTVLSQDQNAHGHHFSAVTLYNDCAACQAAN